MPSIIETVNDQLKNISYLVHSRHRSLHNFMLNLITALIAYIHQSKKPSLKLDELLKTSSVLCLFRSLLIFLI